MRNIMTQYYKPTLETWGKKEEKIGAEGICSRYSAQSSSIQVNKCPPSFERSYSVSKSGPLLKLPTK